MVEKTLVPLDGTAGSAVGLPPARVLAATIQAHLRLLRVIQRHGERATPDTEEASRYLARIRDELQRSDLQVDTQVREGNAPGSRSSTRPHSGLPIWW